jgi:starch-binding outer membrane protein, SusD/RagB family
MKKSIILTFISIFAFCISCKEDILDKANPNDPSPSTYYKTGPQLETAVNAAYSSLQSLQLFAREYFFVHDMRSDETQIGGNLEAARQQLLNGEQVPTNPLINDVWTGWYRLINQTNQVIENAPKATENITEPFRLRVVGEAKFLRALGYFDLLVLFGGVPLIVKPAVTAEDVQPRATEDQVYAQIIQDLQDAISGLPNKTEYNNAQIGRASKQAAQNLLARVYMQQGKYPEAKEQLLAIVSSNIFSNWKSVNYAWNFDEEHEYNAESIFEVSFSTSFSDFGWDATGQGQGMETTVRGQEYSPNPAGWRNLIPSDALLAAFEPNDPRDTVSFYRPGDKYNNGKNVVDVNNFSIKDKPVSWRKYTRIYKDETEKSKSGINFRVMRYAEVLLNLAECENALGNHDTAIGYINEVRSRVGMPGLALGQGAAATFTAVVHERQVELNAEQHRNRDILRWKKLGKATINPVANFKPLLPIPQNEISNNKKLTQADQNPGY